MMASVLVNGSTLEMTVSDSSQIPTAAHLAAAHPELVARGSADSAVAHGSRPQIDAVSTITEYLDRSDWRVNANANQGYSLGGMILNTSGKVIANYWLSQIYSQEAGDAHRAGDVHIHDLDMFAGYCAGWSLKNLLQQGFNGVPGKIASAPAKHFSSAVGQIVNFLGTLQNEWAGAQAFSSFDTYMAPFVRLDSMTYTQVLQCMQELIFNLNVPSRWGTQTPFTNLTFDWTCPADLADEHPLIGDDVCDFAYGDLQAEMDLINRAFMEVMTEGDAEGRVWEEVLAMDPRLAGWRTGRDVQWPGGESGALVQRRVSRTLERIHESEPEGVVLVFSHGTAIRMGAAAMVGWGVDAVWRLDSMDNCCSTGLALTSTGWRLDHFNASPQWHASTPQ